MYTLVATIIFTILFLMWRKDDIFNFMIKLSLILMAGWGFYETLNGAI